MEYLPGKRPRRDDARQGSLPEGLGDILKREIAREARARARVDARVRAKWNEVVGPEIAQRTSPVGFSNGILRVRVESSALLAELAGVYRRELMAAMAEGEGPVVVREIRFELAGAAPPD